MELLWKSSPKTALEVTKELESKTEWAGNTVRTMLTRLINKEVLTIAKNQSGTRVFSPAIQREACVAIEGQSFAQRFFGGAAKPLLVHFAQNSNLSPADVEELKKLLDDSSQNNQQN